MKYVIFYNFLGGYVDYHLSADPKVSSKHEHVSTRVTSDVLGNVTAHLWQSVYLRCTVTGFIQG